MARRWKSVSRPDGGVSHISDRTLLCGPGNRLKTNAVTLSGLRRENRIGIDGVGAHKGCLGGAFGGRSEGGPAFSRHYYVNMSFSMPVSWHRETLPARAASSI